MWLTRLALKHPILILMLTIMGVVLGLASLSRLPVDLFPNISIPMVLVGTFYPGASPEDIEKTITVPLERSLASVPDVDHVESVSKQGASVIRVWFNWGANLDTGELDVIEHVQQVQSQLPTGVQQPFVLKIDLSNIPVCNVTVSGGGYNEQELYDLAYNTIEPQLEHLPHVASAAVAGGKVRQINIEVSRNGAAARGVGLQQIVGAIQQSNLLLPSGELKAGQWDYNLFTNTQFTAVDPIGNIVVKAAPDGTVVRLRDVARIIDGTQETDNIARVNGRRGVYLSIQKQSGANTVEVVDAVRAALKKGLRNVPPGIHLDINFDQSTYIRQSISSLVHEALQGGVLAVFIIFLFLLSLRTTVVIGLAIPISIVCTFLLLFFTGQSLNVFTLGGLALAVGRLVDDSIVELENIFRHFGFERDREKAVLDAAQEVAMPIFASTVTTCVVFAPVVFMQGIAKLLFIPFTLTITFALFTSFAVSRTVTPLLCLKVLSHETPPSIQSPRRIERWLSRVHAAWRAMDSGYRSVLGWALRHKKLVVLGTVGAFLGSLSLAKVVGSEFFPDTDESQFQMIIKAPVGTRVEQTERIVEGIEQTIDQVIPARDREVVVSNIGTPSGRAGLWTPNSGPHAAVVMVYLSEPDRRHHSQNQWMERVRAALRGRYPGVSIFFNPGGIVSRVMNFGYAAKLDVEVAGYDLKQGARYSETIAAAMRKVPGTRDVQISRDEDYPEYHIMVDRQKAGALGLTESGIAQTVLTAISGSTNEPAVFTDPVSGNEYNIVVRYLDRERQSIDALPRVELTTAAGQQVPLATVARIVRTAGPVEIDRKYQERTIDITANVVGRDLGSTSADIQKALDRLPAPPGFVATMTGQTQEQKGAFLNLLLAALLAIALVYMVLASQFESLLDPLVIMFSVPMGLTGVFLALLLTHTALSVNSFMGIIMMVGIVVSNGVLLVDYANLLRERGKPLYQAVLEAGETRLRPILMTTLATVLGLIPMAIGIGAGSESNAPLARAVIGGLSVSTAVTLLLIPALYTAFEERLERRRAKSGPSA